MEFFYARGSTAVQAIACITVGVCFWLLLTLLGGTTWGFDFAMAALLGLVVIFFAQRTVHRRCAIRLTPTHLYRNRGGRDHRVLWEDFEDGFAELLGEEEEEELDVRILEAVLSRECRLEEPVDPELSLRDLSSRDQRRLLKAVRFYLDHMEFRRELSDRAQADRRLELLVA